MPLVYAVYALRWAGVYARSLAVAINTLAVASGWTVIDIPFQLVPRRICGYTGLVLRRRTLPHTPVLHACAVVCKRPQFDTVVNLADALHYHPTQLLPQFWLTAGLTQPRHALIRTTFSAPTPAVVGYRLVHVCVVY